MKLNKKQTGVILAIIGLPFLSLILYAAARGSGTNTGRSIGSPAQQVYLPATREEPSTEGGSPFTHSTNSINSNFTIISSAIYNLENLAGNTNYIQLRGTLQTGATFYVSSGTIDQTLFVGSMTARGTITSTSGFVGSGFGLYNFTIPASALIGGATSYIQNSASLQASSTFYVSSASVDGQTLLSRTSGNVGISSSTPVYALGVTGGILATSSITAGNFVGSGTAITNLDASNLVQGTVARARLQTNLQDTGGSTILVSTNALQSSTVLYVASASIDGQTILARSGGNVGIGTPIPGALLHVNGTSRFNEASTFFSTAISSKVSLNAEHVAFTSINAATASTPNKISTEWDLQSDQGIRGALNLEVTMPVITNASRKTHVAFLTSQSGAQSENFTIDGNNVGISTSGPITALSVVGTITQTAVKSCSLGLTTDAFGSITGCAASDKSIKTNIKALEPGGAIIDGLRPVTYLWNKKAKKDNQLHAGFVAQDVEKVFPHAVVSSGEKLKGVDPNALIALLVKEVQYLRKRVMALEMGTK